MPCGSLEIIATIDLPGRPHDIFVDNGTIWATLSDRSELAKVAASEVTLLETDGSPHDLIVDDSGRVWFSQLACLHTEHLRPCTEHDRDGTGRRCRATPLRPRR